MLPETVGGNHQGILDDSNPDFLIDGLAFDCYSPNTLKVRTLDTTLNKKTNTQATRIIMNLDDCDIPLDDVVEQLYTWPVKNLEELIVVKDGRIARLFIK